MPPPGGGHSVKSVQEQLYEARDTAFVAGMGALLVPYLAMAFLASSLGIELFNMDAWESAPKWMMIPCMVLFIGGWQGMHYLVVKRHKPKATDE